jgi:hypothetical protein
MLTSQGRLLPNCKRLTRHEWWSDALPPPHAADLLALLPPLLALGWWKYAAWKAEDERRAGEAEREGVFTFYFGITH